MAQAADNVSAPASLPAAPAPHPESDKSAKYDVTRIGQRDIGHGLNLYSLEKEHALGEAMASSFEATTKFIVDPEVTGYVNRLGQKIVRNSDSELPFTIKVIDSPSRRVFALPGGFLYVDKGLILEVDSEAELAGLMAHEIAHVAARHATRFVTRRNAWNMLSIPLACLGPIGLAARPIGPLSLKKFTRDAEMEADLLGVEYQWAAGYDPQAFVEVLERLHGKDMQLRQRIAKAVPVTAKAPLHDQIAHAFASYPTTEERIQRLQDEISTLLPARDDYVLDSSDFEDVKSKLIWADPPILRRHHATDAPANAPVLHRRPPDREPQTNLAGNSPFVTKGRAPSVFSYLPLFP